MKKEVKVVMVPESCFNELIISKMKYDAIVNALIKNAFSNAGLDEHVLFDNSCDYKQIQTTAAMYQCRDIEDLGRYE